MEIDKIFFVLFQDGTIINEMKGVKCILCFVLCVTVVESLDINWFKAISSGIKLGRALLISEEDVARIATEEVVVFDQAESVYSNFSAYTRRLKHLMKHVDSMEGVELNFKVYKSGEANAFACPDGSVRVLSGLMDLLYDDELLGVLGHEVGHVMLKHSYNSWRNSLLTGAASDAVGAISETWSILSDSVLGVIGSAALSAKYSRSQESEADDFGYKFLKDHGYNPWALVSAFEKLKTAAEVDDSFVAKALQLFSSHPDLDERISRLAEKAIKDGFQKPDGMLHWTSGFFKSLLHYVWW